MLEVLFIYRLSTNLRTNNWRSVHNSMLYNMKMNPTRFLALSLMALTTTPTTSAMRMMRGGKKIDPQNILTPPTAAPTAAPTASNVSRVPFRFFAITILLPSSLTHFTDHSRIWFFYPRRLRRVSLELRATPVTKDLPE